MHSQVLLSTMHVQVCTLDRYGEHQRKHLLHARYRMCICAMYMMMIAFITIQSSLVLLIEGLCAQIYFTFEISVVLLTSSSFFFVKEKPC